MIQRLLSHNQDVDQDLQIGLRNHDIPYKSTDIQGECTLQRIRAIKFIRWRFYLLIVVSIFTLGILLLPFYWYPELQRWIYYEFCEIDEASHFYINNSDSTITIVENQHGNVINSQNQTMETFFFVNRYLKYTYNLQDRLFEAVSFNYFPRISQLLNKEKISGLNSEQVKKLRETYGLGVMQIPTPGCFILFLRQIVQPFFIFVVYSVILWCYQQYYYYASIIAFTSIVSVGVNLWEIMSLNKKIFQMAYYETKVNVLRNQEIIQLSSKLLVPGDIVFLKNQIKLPFDGVLLEGTILVNQCALTGQSIPVVKKGIDPLQFNSKRITDKNSILYEGTQIIQICSQTLPTKYSEKGLLACVTKTNFATMKGQLVRVITFPKTRQMRFYIESAKFLVFLFCLTVVSYAILACKLIKFIPLGQLIVKFLDLITITVPPGLPASMSIGIAYSINRLKARGVYCISPDKIMVGGQINHICFDKTGTLTQLYMDFYQFIPNMGKQFQQPITFDDKHNVGKYLLNSEQYRHALINMAACHSLIKLQNTSQIVGDPMQMKLFQFTGFQLMSLEYTDLVKQSIKKLQDKHLMKFINHQNQIGGNVSKRFQFDSDIQRMSVVVSLDSNQQNSFVYCKGSPESLIKIMKQNTVPINYFQILKKYASSGFRILSIAYKQITSQEASNIDRISAEKDLLFCGFQVFENKLKPQTVPTIQILKYEAGINMVIITGDNPLTAANIGFRSGIIQSRFNLMVCEVVSDRVVRVSNFHEITNTKLPLLSHSVTDQNTFQLQQVKNKNQKDFQCLIQDLPKRIIQIGKSSKYVFCLTGQVFQKLHDKNLFTEQNQTFILSFLEYVKVFARSKPNDKTRIISSFQSIGKITAMCGDGANDCGALKQADAGLSLSNSEASIAAPFTSKVTNISSMIDLIRQCRGGLATNFSLFNIMALYSLIQYTSTIIVQYFYAYPSDLQFLYWDLGCNFLFFMSIGNTDSAQKLSRLIPSDSLFRFSNLVYVLFMFFTQLYFQILTVYIMMTPPWSQYIRYWEIGGQQKNLANFQLQNTLIKTSVQATTVFLVSNFLYLFSVIGFCISSPWKKQFYTNRFFMIVYLLIMLYTCLICVVQKLRIPGLELVELDIRFGFLLMVLGISFGSLMYFNQKYILQKVMGKIKAKFPNKKWL